MGACIQCCVPTCFTSFHVTCARKENYMMIMKNMDPSTIKVYCKRHAPVSDPTAVTVLRLKQFPFNLVRIPMLMTLKKNRSWLTMKLSLPMKWLKRISGRKRQNHQFQPHWLNQHACLNGAMNRLLLLIILLIEFTWPWKIISLPENNSLPNRCSSTGPLSEKFTEVHPY